MTDEDVVRVIAEQIVRMKKEIENHQTRYVSTAISKVEDTVYYCKIDGSEYRIPNKTDIAFIRGDKVMVVIPNNNFTKMFIVSRG